MEDNNERAQQVEPNAGWNTRGGAKKLYVCHKFDCDFRTFEPLANCPDCGFTMLDPMAVRTFGVIMAVLGGMLGLGGAALLIFVAPNIPKSGAAKYAIIGLFVALLAGGAVAAIAGFNQASTAKKSSRLIAAFAAIFVVLAIAAAVARMFI